MRPDKTNTLTCKSTSINDAPRILPPCPHYMEYFPDTPCPYATSTSTYRYMSMPMSTYTYMPMYTSKYKSTTTSKSKYTSTSTSTPTSTYILPASRTIS